MGRWEEGDAEGMEVGWEGGPDVVEGALGGEWQARGVSMRLREVEDRNEPIRVNKGERSRLPELTSIVTFALAWAPPPSRLRPDARPPSQPPLARPTARSTRPSPQSPVHRLGSYSTRNFHQPRSDPVIVLSLAVVFVFSVVFLHLFTKGMKWFLK